MANKLYAGDPIQVLFYFMGVFGILLGTTIMIYSYFGFRPKLNGLTDQAIESLQAVDQITNRINIALDENPAVMTASLKTLSSGNKLIHLFPDLLTTLRGNLIQASQTLDAAGKTAKQSTEGLAGLVTPTEALHKGNISLRKTADQVRLLAGMVNEFNSATIELTDNMTDFSNLISQLKSDLGPFNSLLGDVHTRIVSIRQALQNAALPLHLAGLGIIFGGFYIYLGIFSLALGVISARTEQRVPGDATAVNATGFLRSHSTISEKWASKPRKFGPRQ